MGRSVRNTGLHIFGWVLFFSLILGFMNRSSDALSLTRFFEPDFLLFAAVYVSLFYTNAYVLIPQLYLKQKYLLYFLISLLLFAGVYTLRPYDRLLAHQVRPANAAPFPEFRRMPPPPRDGPMPQRPGPDKRGRGLDIISVVLFLSVWSFSTALPIIRQWRQSERRALQAEADRVNAELSFLKAQINPHFLFNTLNNIYSLSIANSGQTPAAILKLSEILHYITDDVRADFVPLQSEVDCVRNYIELQKLRLTDKVDVRFAINGTLAGKQIAPLLFMTFIENAFKYGISSHESCIINIAINAGEQSIAFFCRNKIMVKNAVEERAGVGIGNAKKRLEYLYAGKYLLNIDTENGHFSVHLTIRL